MIQTRKIRHPREFGKAKDQKKSIANHGKKVFIVYSVVFLVCCLLIWWSRWTIITFAWQVWIGIWSVISQGTRHVISKSLWTEPKLDAQWNLNVALIGYGWATHAGWYLTDTLIIASINVKKGTMSMFSIPRDLYVKKEDGWYGKLNSVFPSAFYRNDENYDKAAAILLAKMNEITGIPLHYYAFVDFTWFETFIDTLEWVEIDVREPIYDNAYPWANNSYIVFSLSSWQQILDWATALKYARSRHSTSDYDRSLRQQQIIQWIIDKLTSSDTFLHPWKIKELHTQATSFIKTNLNLDEILWGLPYIKKIDKKSSRQLAACGNYQWQQSQPGCLLYTPPMEAFGGASVQLPAWASPANVSNYSIVKSYISDTMMNHDFLAEAPSIRVLNGINTGVNTAYRNVPVANNTAISLVEAWFKIFDTWNAPTSQTQTIIETKWTWRHASIKKLQVFFPAAKVIESSSIPEDGPWIILTIWDDYANKKIDRNTLPLYLQ